MLKQELLKTDLKELTPKDFYMKHIVKSHNWYFSNYLNIPQNELVDRMDCFKEIVSINLGINFHNVQIVGSAKIGYSLSPRKLLNPFHDEIQGKPSSDIDIAVISDPLYRLFWSKLRQVKGLWNQVYYKNLTQSIFRGYINDKDLQKINVVKDEWDNLVRPINVLLQDNLGFVHPITYRLYRSWEDLEEYQLISISKAKNSLEEKSDV